MTHYYVMGFRNPLRAVEPMQAHAAGFYSNCWLSRASSPGPGTATMLRQAFRLRNLNCRWQHPASRHIFDPQSEQL